MHESDLTILDDDDAAKELGLSVRDVSLRRAVILCERKEILQHRRLQQPPIPVSLPCSTVVQLHLEGFGIINEHFSTLPNGADEFLRALLLSADHRQPRPSLFELRAKCAEICSQTPAVRSPEPANGIHDSGLIVPQR